MKCPNCGFDRILPMYKVCPKCKQPVNANAVVENTSKTSQPVPETKLLTGIFWSYQKAIKDPAAFKEYARRNPNDSARLLIKWKEDGRDISSLAEAHPINTPSNESATEKHRITEKVNEPEKQEESKPASSEESAAPSSLKPGSTELKPIKNDVVQLSTITKSNSFVTWTIAPGQIARNISAQEFVLLDESDGVYVQEGVTAILFINGEQAAELQGGLYTFKTEKVHSKAKEEYEKEQQEIREKEGLVQRIGRVGRSVWQFFYHSEKQIKEESEKHREHMRERIRKISSDSVIAVVLKRDGATSLTMGIHPVTAEDGSTRMEFAPYKIRTKTLTIDVAIAMEAKIYDFHEFRTTYLMDQSSYSINDLRVALNTFLRTTLQRAMQNYAADGDLLPQDLMSSISYDIMAQSRELLHGIAISNVLDITTENEAFERFRAIEEKFFCTEKEIDYLSRTNEFKNRLQSVENQQKITEAETELDLRKELDRINNDQLIHEDEMDAFVQLLQSQKRIREARTENEELAALLKLKGSRLLSEDEFNALENSIRDKKFDREQVSAQFQLNAAHRTEMMRVQVNTELSKSKLLAEAELEDVRFEELRKEQERSFLMDDARQIHDLDATRRQDEYTDTRREKEAEFTDARREKDAYFADSRREKDFDFEQRQKEAEYARTHREAYDNLDIEKQRSQNEMDILRQKAEIARQNMEAMQQHEQEMAEKKHQEEMARIAAQQSMSSEQLMAAGLAEMSIEAQKAFAESFAAGKGGEKEREMYERMLQMQQQHAGESTAQSATQMAQMQAMMQQMMQFAQSGMQTNATMAANMAAAQSAQQQTNLDAIQNVAGARVAHTEGMKEEYRKQMEHEQKRTDAAQDKALSYTTKVTQEEIKAAAKTGKAISKSEEQMYYIPDFGSEYSLKEVGNLILNGSIDPETELEINGESLTVAEVDELFPFLEKKYNA